MFDDSSNEDGYYDSVEDANCSSDGAAVEQPQSVWAARKKEARKLPDNRWFLTQLMLAHYPAACS